MNNWIQFFGRNRLIINKEYEKFLKETPQPLFLNALFKMITSGPVGVNVLFSPPNSGKTVSTVHACKVTGYVGHSSIVVDCSKFNNELFEEFNLLWSKIIPFYKPKDSISFHNLFSEKRGVIVLDHFDDLYSKYDETDLELLIVSLALRSAKYNNFLTQVNTNRFETYKKLLKFNSGKHLSPIIW